MQLTGGQSKFEFMTDQNLSENKKSSISKNIDIDNDKLVQITATKADLTEHNNRLSDIESNTLERTIWRRS